MTNNYDISEFYPRWLVDKAFCDWFDWDESSIYSTFEKFNKLASLHDSYWCGLFTYMDNSANIIISFDAFWNEKIAKHPGPMIRDWPFLVIKIEKVYQITCHSDLDNGTTIAGVKSEIIPESVKEGSIDARLIKTVVEDAGGGCIEIVHQESIRILLFDCIGNLIKLPEEMKVMN
jgi:hypothetical protein